MSKRVFVLTSAILRGGGPPGYVYNQMVGYETLQRTGRVTNEFIFLGKTRLHDRPPTLGPATSTIKDLIIALGAKRTIQDVMAIFSQRQRQFKQEIDKADVIIFQGLYNTHLARRAKRRGIVVYMPHSPVIAADEIRDALSDSGKRMRTGSHKSFENEERDMIRIADAVVFASVGAGAEYKQHFSDDLAGKVAYLKSGIRVTAAAESKNTDNILPRDRVTILSAGRYASHRGVDLFWSAAHRLAEMGCDAAFYTAGSGPLKMETPHVGDLGWREDIFDVIRAADIIVVPNRRGYYDLFPIECAALGKPLVMTRVGGNADIAGDLPDVIPCEPTVESLVDAIQTAIETYKNSPGWGERNRQSYEAAFTAECLAQRWDDYVSSLTAKQCPMPSRVGAAP